MKATKKQKAEIIRLSTTYHDILVAYVENLKAGIVGMYGEKEITFYSAMQAWGELRGYVAAVYGASVSDVIRCGNTAWLLMGEHGIRISGNRDNVAFM